MGVKVSETTAETSTAIDSVRANSRNMRPTSPPMNNRGMNTASNEQVSETTVKPISEAPWKAAFFAPSPASRWRAMFSIMTMASSTTKPVPTVSAISDRLSSPNPKSHISANVPISDRGSAVPAIRVADHVRRNRRTTRMTSATLSKSVNCTSAIDARMVPVRSLTTASRASPGRARCSRSSSTRMRATVSTMLAPGWRLMSTTTAGSPWYQAPINAFSNPSSICATSRNSTGAPLR